MIRALIDTNVLLDAMAAIAPYREDAERVILLAAEERIEGFITARTMVEVYRFLRADLSEHDAREALRALLEIFTLMDVYAADCVAALELPMDGYADAVTSVCCNRMGLDYIVTRSQRFLQSAAVAPTISPAYFLEKMED